jgi:hypothetical protein
LAKRRCFVLVLPMPWLSLISLTGFPQPAVICHRYLGSKLGLLPTLMVSSL